MAAPGIVSVASMTYRDAPEEWSNKWHFQGAAPSTPADWRSLVDAFVLLFKTVLPTSVSIHRFYCYTDTDHVSVYTYDLSAFGGYVAGTHASSGTDTIFPPGDAAALLRWNTGRVSSRGKPVYLFKYLHRPWLQDTDTDKLGSGQLAANSAFANNVRSSSGAWPGLAGPDGVAPIGYLAETYVTTRTLKRRGRRPT